LPRSSLCCGARLGLAHAGQFAFSGVVGEEAVVADLGEGAGQQVPAEPADELLRGERLHLLRAALQ